MKLTDFSIRPGGRTVNCLLAEPGPGKLAADPAIVLTFASSRQDAISAPVYDIAARAFLDAGHRAVSFDLPHHGERIVPPVEGIHGFRDAALAGRDSFDEFVADGRALIDECLERGWAKPGRIYANGVSRGAYCAMRLMAADDRIVATGAQAPVTDWRMLTEFAEVKDRPEIAALDLENHVERFVGRGLYIAIGNADHRVGTHRVASFVTKLLAAEARAGIQDSRHLIHFVNKTPGHGLGNDWRVRSAEYLLDLASTPGTSGA